MITCTLLRQRKLLLVFASAAFAVGCAVISTLSYAQSTSKIGSYAVAIWPFAVWEKPELSTTKIRAPFKWVRLEPRP